MGKFDQVITLATSTRYANPEQVGQLLPDVYGDLRTGGEGGLLPAVLIDTVNFVYLCANHAIEAIDSVWDSNGAQLLAGFATNVSVNQEGQGIVAIIDFTTVQTGPIYWRGRGKQSGGSLITNPISAWEDFLKTRAGWVAGDFDPTTLEKARAACTAQGYTFAAWIGQERTIKSWLAEWGQDILADHWLDRLERLVIDVETAAYWQEPALAGHVVASRDVVDGENGVEMTMDLQNLANVLRQYHLWHERRGDYSSVVEATKAASQNAFGNRIKPLTYPTVRSTAHLSAVATVLFTLFDGRTPPAGAVLRFALHGMKFCNVTRGDRIGFYWDHGPAFSGDQYRNRVLKILNVELSLPGGPITIEALDIGQRLISDYWYDADGGPSSGYFDAAYDFGGAADLALRP